MLFLIAHFIFYVINLVVKLNKKKKLELIQICNV